MATAIIAGPSLQALFGHVILVAGEELQLGDDGRAVASDPVAEVLLGQEGWSRAEPPAEPDAAGAEPTKERPRRRQERA